MNLDNYLDEIEIWEHDIETNTKAIWALWHTIKDFAEFAKGRGWKQMSPTVWKDINTGNVYYAQEQ